MFEFGQFLSSFYLPNKSLLSRHGNDSLFVNRPLLLKNKGSTPDRPKGRPFYESAGNLTEIIFLSSPRTKYIYTFGLLFPSEQVSFRMPPWTYFELHHFNDITLQSFIDSGIWTLLWRQILPKNTLINSQQGTKPYQMCSFYHFTCCNCCLCSCEIQKS